jgi:uncharacterized membrane protein YwzB
MKSPKTKAVRFYYVMLCAALITGCGSPGADPSKIYKQGFEDGVKYVTDQIRTAKEEAVSKLRGEVRGRLIFVSLLAVALVLLGPTIAENARSAIMQQFQLSKKAQVEIASTIFILISLSLFLASFFMEELRMVQQGVWILVGGSALPFFGEYVPALQGDDKVRRKAALSKVKSLLFIILVYWFVFRLLSADGIFGVGVTGPDPTAGAISG